MKKEGTASLCLSIISSIILFRFCAFAETLHPEAVLHEIGGWTDVENLLGPPDGKYAYTANSSTTRWGKRSEGAAVWLDFGRIVRSGTVVIHHDDPGVHKTSMGIGVREAYYGEPAPTDRGGRHANIQGTGVVTCYMAPIEFRYLRLDHFTMDPQFQDGIDAVAVIEGEPPVGGLYLDPAPAKKGAPLYAVSQWNSAPDHWDNPESILGKPDGVCAWSCNPGIYSPRLIVDLGRVVYSGNIVIYHDKTDLGQISSLGVSINSVEYDADPETAPELDPPGGEGWEYVWGGHESPGATTLQFPPTRFRYIHFCQSTAGGEDGIDAVEVYESVAATSGTISGTVTLDDTPLQGVPVYLLPAMGAGRWNNLTFDKMALGIPDDPKNYAFQVRETGDGGGYEFADVPFGKYEVGICPVRCLAQLELRRVSLGGPTVALHFEMQTIDQEFTATNWGPYPSPPVRESTLVTYWIDPSLGGEWGKAIKYALELWSQIGRDCNGVSVPYLRFAASPKNVADIRFVPGWLPPDKPGHTFLGANLFDAVLYAHDSLAPVDYVEHWLLFGRNLIFIAFNTEQLHPAYAFGTDEDPLPQIYDIPETGQRSRTVHCYLDGSPDDQHLTGDMVRVSIHEVGHALGLAHPPDIRAYSIMRSEAWSGNEWGRFLGWGDVIGIEKLYGLPGEPDSDNDGYTDADEQTENQSDPADPGSTPADNDLDRASDLRDPDDDNDGMPDDWERRYEALDPLTVDSHHDLDGDGLTNFGEYAAGTDPSNPMSVFAAESPLVEEGGVTLTWSSVAGKRYRIWGSDNLVAWRLLADAIPAEDLGDATCWTGASNPTQQVGYYRVEVIP
jgi:hypothetical protein